MTRLRWTLTAIVALAAGIAAASARADFDPEAWRTWREIRVPEGAAGETARFAIDNHISDNTSGPDLTDLRILRGDADDIGYVVYVPEEGRPQSVPRPARVFNNVRRGREASELTLDLGEEPPMVNRIHIRTGAENFGCAVTVEGSDDGNAWKVIRGDAAIFHFGRDIQRRFTTVTIPDTRMRYLRVIVAAPPNAGPIDLSGADVVQEAAPEPSDLPLLVDRPVINRAEAQEMRQTVFTLDLGARRLPVSRIVFETPEENLARSVQFQTSDDSKHWTPAGGGFIFRYKTDRYREERLGVEIPEAFGRFVRITVVNGDDPPLAMVRFVVQGRPRYVFFPFKAGQQYRVFYGNRNARPPQYDYANVFRRVDRRAAIEARMGDPQPNPRFIATREAETAPPWVQRNQWVLYVALAAAVIALAIVAMRALRRPPSEQSSPDA